jgi:hypothetical protein
MTQTAMFSRREGVRALQEANSEQGIGYLYSLLAISLFVPK